MNPPPLNFRPHFWRPGRRQRAHRRRRRPALSRRDGHSGGRQRPRAAGGRAVRRESVARALGLARRADRSVSLVSAHRAAGQAVGDRREKQTQIDGRGGLFAGERLAISSKPTKF